MNGEPFGAVGNWSAIAALFVWFAIHLWGNGFGWIELTAPAALAGAVIATLYGAGMMIRRSRTAGPHALRQWLLFFFWTPMMGAMLAMGFAAALNRFVPVTNAEPRALKIVAFHYHRSGSVVHFADHTARTYAHRFDDPFKRENPVGTEFIFYIRRGLLGQEFFTHHERIK